MALQDKRKRMINNFEKKKSINQSTDWKKTPTCGVERGWASLTSPPSKSTGAAEARNTFWCGLTRFGSASEVGANKL